MKDPVEMAENGRGHHGLHSNLPLNMWLQSAAGPASWIRGGRGCCLLSPECLPCVLQVLLPAAGLLQLQDVKKTCCEFLESQLHPVNCLGIRAFADMHACTDLLNKANTYAGKCNKPLQAGFETGGRQTPEISVTPQCAVESPVRLLDLV